ncbi:MAG: serine protease, partial [Gloeobacteraceae cyanobacterium ES-bin-144]|nr:serine protease [Verrucomicrobiales bacterium]
VTVVMPGVDATRPALQIGNRPVPVQVIGVDLVSRLGFLKAEGGMIPKPIEWSDDTAASASAALQAIAPSGPIKCRTAGWVKQVGGKILPLALLRVNFDQTVPPPGTPLVDSAGRVVGIVFQAAGAGNAGYAIPAEAVRRVQHDLLSGGRLVRGWLGLSLKAENQSPQIVRVLPNSPAAAAGIKPGDVLLNVGNRQVTDYADAANAFFYLIPGQAVRVKLLRGVDQFEYSLTPTKPQAE